MSVITSRFNQSRESAKAKLEQGKKYRAVLLERMGVHRQGFERFKAKYDGCLPSFTSTYEVRAVECWRSGAAQGLLSDRDRPAWVRKGAWS